MIAGQGAQFGGEEHFQASPERLYAQLTDLDAMTRTIPDLVSAEPIDERSLRCVVRPGFSFLRGSLRLVISLADLKPPEEATMKIDAAGHRRVDARRLEAANRRREWRLEAVLGGSDRRDQGPGGGAEPGPHQSRRGPGDPPRLDTGPQAIGRVIESEAASPQICGRQSSLPHAS